MNRTVARIATTLALLAPPLIAAATPAHALPDQCTNERPAGATILAGSTVTPVAATYEVTTTGTRVTVGGLGTLDIYTNQLDIGVAYRNALGGPTTYYAGIDPSGGDTYGMHWELAACASSGSTGGTYYVDVHDIDPARPGVAVRLLLCPSSGICQVLLGFTGAEVNLGVPLASCVWIDGRQQNEISGSCPALADPRGGLPLGA